MKILLIVIVGLGTGCQTTVGNYLGNRTRDLGECFRLQVGVGPGIGGSASALGLLHGGLAVGGGWRQHGIGWVYGEGYAFGYGTRARGWDAEVDWLIIPPALVGAALYGFVELAALSAAGSVRYVGPGPERPSLSRTLPGRDDPRSRDRLVKLHWRIEAAREATLSLISAEHACPGVIPGILSRVGERMADPPSGRPRPPSEEHARLWTRDAHRLNPRAHVHAFDVEASVYGGVVYAKVGFSPGELLDFLLGWFGADIAGDDRSLSE